jgi:single-strand DNA-binding protein
MYLNKAFIIGNLTRDPELKSLPSGIQVASFSVATNRIWKDKAGVKQETPDYHNVVVFGKQADIVSQYLKKGSSVLCEGRMQTRSWDGADGQKRYRTEIVADRVQFGPRAGGAPSSGGSFQKSADASGKDTKDAKAPAKEDEGFDAIQYPEEEINPEDIPF